MENKNFNKYAKELEETFSKCEALSKELSASYVNCLKTKWNNKSEGINCLVETYAKLDALNGLVTDYKKSKENILSFEVVTAMEMMSFFLR